MINILSSTHVGPVYPSNGHVHELLIQCACRIQSMAEGGSGGGSTVDDDPIDPINYCVCHAVKILFIF